MVTGFYLGDINSVMVFDRYLTMNEIKAIGRYIVKKLSVSLASRSAAPLIIGLGQSNLTGADSYANATNFSANDTITNAAVFNVNSAGIGSYPTLELDVNDAGGGLSANNFGIMPGCMDEVNTLDSLSDTHYWTLSENGNSPISDFLPETTFHDSYKINFTRAVEALEQLDIDPEIYLIWAQGENDAIDLTPRTTYLSHLTDIYNSLQEMTYGYGITRYTLNKIVRASGSFGGEDEINAAFNDFISTVGGGLRLDRARAYVSGDNIHYNSDTQELLGRDAAGWFIDQVVPSL